MLFEFSIFLPGFSYHFCRGNCKVVFLSKKSYLMLMISYWRCWTSRERRKNQFLRFLRFCFFEKWCFWAKSRFCAKKLPYAYDIISAIWEVEKMTIFENRDFFARCCPWPIIFLKFRSAPIAWRLARGKSPAKKKRKRKEKRQEEKKCRRRNTFFPLLPFFFPLALFFAGLFSPG